MINLLIAGQVRIFAGGSTSGTADGIGTNAGLYNPAKLAMDSKGVLFLADYSNHRIRKISAYGN